MNVGKMEEGEKMYDKMRERGIEGDVYLYIVMINFCCRKEDMKRVCCLFDEMVEKSIFFNVYSYGVLINGLCKVGELEVVDMFVNEM